MGLEMTAWFKDFIAKRDQMTAAPGTQVVHRRKNLMSLFREDDRADAEARENLVSGLKESLISKKERLDRKQQSVVVSGNKLRVLVQVLQSWACGNQTSLSLAITKRVDNEPPECHPDAQYSTLVVRHGDCLSEISRLVGIPIDVLQRVNNIANIKYLKPGQNLRIPRKGLTPSKRKRFWDGKIKEDKRVIANWGDTLWSLADDHHVSADEIRRSNNLPSGSSHLYLGQELVIPPPAQPSCTTVSQCPPLRYLLRQENLATIPALRPLISNKLVQALLPKWEPESFGAPCQGGWLSSFYGWKDGRWYFHNGIDIAVERGTDIVASTSGKVTWSGWKGGYGKTVCMDHGNGYVTLYAHCDNLLVKSGQFVRKGQVIALSGNTGHSTGPHLHFEIHKEGRPVDPLAHIPPL